MKAIIITIGIILIILGGAYFFIFAPKTPTAALLYLQEGNTQVNTGKGWINAVDEMELSQGNKIRTDGTATIVFYEGEIMQLNPNTEIEIEKLNTKKIQTKQNGETLNKITKISGIAEYTIQTPEAVATVRGTLFLQTNTETAVEEGQVSFGTTSQPNLLTIRSGKYASTTNPIEQNIPEEMKQKLAKFKENYKETLKKIRMREILKHKDALKLAEEKGYTIEKIKSELEKIDKGELNEDELFQKIPSTLKPRAKRIYQLTKEIKR